MTNKKSGDLVGYFACIADEFSDKKSCSSGSLAIYRYNKDSQVYYVGFCWSCCQSFDRAEVARSRLACELEELSSKMNNQDVVNEANVQLEGKEKNEGTSFFKALFGWGMVFSVIALMIWAEGMEKGSSVKVFIGVLCLLLFYYLLRKGVSEFTNRLMGLAKFFLVLAVIVAVFGVFSETFSFGHSKHNPTDIYNRR